MRGNEGTTMRWVMTALSAATLAACGGAEVSTSLVATTRSTVCGACNEKKVRWLP